MLSIMLVLCSNVNNIYYKVFGSIVILEYFPCQHLHSSILNAVLECLEPFNIVKMYFQYTLNGLLESINLILVLKY